MRRKEVGTTHSLPLHMSVFVGRGGRVCWGTHWRHPIFNSSCTWHVCRPSWLLCLECSSCVLSRCPVAQGVSKFPEGGIVTLPGPPPKSHPGQALGLCCWYQESSPSTTGRALDKVSGKPMLGPAFLPCMRRSTKGSPRSLL